MKHDRGDTQGAEGVRAGRSGRRSMAEAVKLTDEFIYRIGEALPSRRRWELAGGALSARRASHRMAPGCRPAARAVSGALTRSRSSERSPRPPPAPAVPASSTRASTRWACCCWRPGRPNPVRRRKPRSPGHARKQARTAKAALLGARPGEAVPRGKAGLVQNRPFSGNTTDRARARQAARVGRAGRPFRVSSARGPAGRAIPANAHGNGLSAAPPGFGPPARGARCAGNAGG